MKKIILLLSATLLLTNINATAQDTEVQGIEATLNNYLTGFLTGNAQLIKKAFTADATMKMVEKETYGSYNAIEALTDGIKPLPKTTKTRIVSINNSGNAGSAQLEIQLADLTYIDFMQLLKIKGEWKIVSKIYYTRNH